MEQVESYNEDMLWSSCTSQKLKDVEFNKKKRKSKTTEGKHSEKIGSSAAKILSKKISLSQWRK